MWNWYKQRHWFWKVTLAAVILPLCVAGLFFGSKKSHARGGGGGL